MSAQRKTTRAAVTAVRRELLVQAEQPTAGVSQEQAQRVTELALTTAPPTQVRRPWRATVRTLFQLAVALAAILPALVDASGLDDTVPLLAGALAIAAAITRVMALPSVEAFLAQFLPFLAAAPRAHE